MNSELRLGEYEFFPYDDELEDTEDGLEKLKELMKTVKNARKVKALFKTNLRNVKGRMTKSNRERKTVVNQRQSQARDFVA